MKLPTKQKATPVSQQSQQHTFDTTTSKTPSQKASGRGQIVLEMTHNYPFGVAQNQDCACLVKQQKIFRPTEYSEMKRLIETNSILRHRNLVEMVRVMECKSDNQFQIFYEYVPQSLESAFSRLTNEQICRAKFDLLQVCRYLLQANISPEICSKNLGLKDRSVKLFLPFKKDQQKPIRKQSLAIKQLEIRSLFNHLSKKISAPAKNSINTRSQEQLNSLQSHHLFEFPTQSPRNSSLTCLNSKEAAVRQIDFNKIKNIDEKIKKIQQKISKHPQHRPSDFSHGLNESAEVRKETPQNPKVSNALFKYMEAHQYNIRQGRNEPLQEPELALKVYKYQEQDSFDTYCQQLGDDLSIPKIPHKEMRQTTKSPPRLLFRDKLHESVGNQRNIIKNTAMIQEEKKQEAEKSSSRQISLDKLMSSQKEFLKKAASTIEIQDSLTKKESPKNKNQKQARKTFSQFEDRNQGRCQNKYAAKFKIIEDRLNEIKYVQTELGARKHSLQRKSQDRRNERKFTEPRTNDKKRHDNKYCDVVYEVNGMLTTYEATDTRNSKHSSIRVQPTKKAQINERVRQALKKSQATLESFRSKMSRRAQKVVY